MLVAVLLVENVLVRVWLVWVVVLVAVVLPW